MSDASLLELMAASPKFAEMLRDLKRLEKHMTDAEKDRVVALVKEAMKAQPRPARPAPPALDCGCTDIFGCPHDERINEVEVMRETEEIERKRRQRRQA